MSTSKLSMGMLFSFVLGISLLNASARAQETPNADPGANAASGARVGGKHRGGGKQQTEEQKSAPRADEKAARSAIEALPDQKYDPWHNMR